jgi:CheY-like chemotaxis protein
METSSAGSTATAPSVLVVDDEPSIREVLADTLSEEGWSVVAAGDGKEAFKHLESGLRPTAIVLDIMMPRMNGHEFMEALRSDPRTGSIPVIQISAGRYSAIPGIAARLEKPFRIERLLHLLDTYALAAQAPRSGPPSVRAP